ncbi:type II toxin-antitoxin system Rv0910 family toxin [Streptomyces sp. SID14515]|uniref:type II toxin-antitoxin system Rv0910 family toxin n=1 Tax=Streptomyces sp. SID14515 TaxID=2706074 RepID=UPI0013C6569A|nr:SRPBCC family protein [Streptomyces sp. SID14515]NEB37389.1 hypothetical protein [Streptomyces sp. SID14515]
MAKGVSTIELAASTEDVWTLLSDRTRYDEWLSVHYAWPDGSPADLKVGDVFAQQLKLMGPPSTVRWTVETHKSGTLLELTGQGPTEVGARFSYAVVPTESGSSVELVLELFGGPIDGTLGKMIEPGLCTEMEKSLKNLAELKSRH